MQLWNPWHTVIQDCKARQCRQGGYRNAGKIQVWSWYAFVSYQVFKARLGKCSKGTFKMHGWCKLTSLKGDAESHQVCIG
jgi:IS1 family transposase